MTEPKHTGIIRDAKGRFVPGVPPNPKGRPKDSLSLVGLLKKRLREHPEEADAIIDALVTMSKDKDISAIKEAFDRIDGKVPQPVSGALDLNHSISFTVGKGYDDRNQDTEH